MKTRTTLHLAKENFKFSSAHFLIFDEKSAEKLHGHNYRVKVELEISEQADLDARGFFIDFNVFKREIKATLDQWDEHVLLPARHPDMKFREEGASLHVNFRERYYVFPLNEVIRLPVTNTSVEQLSRLLSEKFAQQFHQWGVTAVTVSVEETSGQGSSTRVEGAQA